MADYRPCGHQDLRNDLRRFRCICEFRAWRDRPVQLELWPT